MAFVGLCDVPNSGVHDDLPISSGQWWVGDRLIGGVVKAVLQYAVCMNLGRTVLRADMRE